MSTVVGARGDTSHSHGDRHGHDHLHDHDDHHGHGNDHELWPDEERAKGGPVVLDVGGDVGALIVTIDSGRVGSELFIRPIDDPDDEFHVAVWERDLPGGRKVTAAVFGSLTAGTYVVLDEPSGRELLRVTVGGGDVIERHITTAAVPLRLRSEQGDDAHHRGGADHART